MAKDKWEFYLDPKGDWRWRRKDGSNGKIVAASTEGYNSYNECAANAAKSGYTG
jgi:uncharacterized protein YegP (UPF0339 family)